MTIRNVEYFFDYDGCANHGRVIATIDENEFVLSHSCAIDPTYASTYAPAITYAVYKNGTDLCAQFISNKNGYAKWFLYVTLIKLG